MVIDVGTNRDDDGSCGDVDFDAVAREAGAITPVPGGVGPMTHRHAAGEHACAAPRAPQATRCRHEQRCGARSALIRGGAPCGCSSTLVRRVDRAPPVKPGARCCDTTALP